ncbi:MAG: hypothetical protein MUP70_11425 [Candidatus Aminicenantes bacterium]|nr:hypothetical protein [Candidatus Aminicenantes bacterium]
MTKKPFILILGILIAFALLIPTACSKGEKLQEEQAAAVETAQAVQPSETDVYTRDDPGAYGGKEDSHVPQVEYVRSNGGIEVTVRVQHEMNPDKPHYIMWIRLFDETGNLLGEKEFQATDEKAEAVFFLDSVPSQLKAYELCNLHGIWMEVVTISPSPF